MSTRETLALLAFAVVLVTLIMGAELIRAQRALVHPPVQPDSAAWALKAGEIYEVVLRAA